jgi:radical SAM protein with 4Fe4S-binding SPASM domain
VKEVKNALRRLSLLKPRLIRIDDHFAVSVLPFWDWGNAFTSRKVYPAKIGFCGYALNNVGVLSNGEVTICCSDYDGKTSLGNLRAESLTSILSSEQARAIREGFQKMKIVHPYCQRCIGSTNRIKTVFKGLVSICLFQVLKLQPAGKMGEVSLFQA